MSENRKEEDRRGSDGRRSGADRRLRVDSVALERRSGIDRRFSECRRVGIDRRLLGAFIMDAG